MVLFVMSVCQLSFSGTLLQLRNFNSISIGVMLQINLALSYCYESEKKIYHISIHGRATAIVTDV